MILRIIIPRSLLKNFREEAVKKFPLEYMETLWGSIEGTTVIVSALGRLPQRGEENKVNYEYADALSHTGRGNIFLGTFHTHPDTQESSPSLADWKTAFDDGEHVFGVMALWRKEGEAKFHFDISWWEPQPGILMIHPREAGKVGKKARKVRKVSEVVIQPALTEAPLVNLTNPSETP